MKISSLIKDIVVEAEEKFGYSEHNNDCISLVVSPTAYGTWCANLERPTQRQMDRGEVEGVHMHTVKLWEATLGFHSEADTLLQALLDLHQKVEDAEPWEFDAC
jgi:hypothetical protein